MTFSETTLKGSYLVALTPMTDSRGWFARTYCKDEFVQIGHSGEWVQINHSFTTHKGTIRGMHYQLEPYSEIKLVRCIHGAVYDVIVDLRQGSPTFLEWFGAELSANNKKMMYIPAGFAHGFQSLEEDSELIYHHSKCFTPSAEAGLMYNDERLNITWPLTVTELSARDGSHPLIDPTFKGL